MANPCQSDNCAVDLQNRAQANRDGIAANANAIDQINAMMSAGDIINNQRNFNRMEDQLDEVLNRLGPKLPNGGVSGKLKKMAEFAEKTWDFLQIDRVLSLMTYATALHNAYFLSSNIVQTLFSGLNNVLQFAGISSPDGSPIDVGAIANKFLEDFAKTIFGVEALEGIKSTWASYSRIYSSAMNVLYGVQNIMDSTRFLVEMAGENIGKIGNALKRSGAVMQGSFGWMQERFDSFSVGNAKWEKMFTRLDQVENVASSMEAVTGEVVSVQEAVGSLKQDREQLKTELESVGFGQTKESAAIAETEAEAKLDSESPLNLEDAQIGRPEEVI